MRMISSPTWSTRWKPWRRQSGCRWGEANRHHKLLAIRRKDDLSDPCSKTIPGLLRPGCSLRCDLQLEKELKRKLQDTRVMGAVRAKKTLTRAQRRIAG